MQPEEQSSEFSIFRAEDQTALKPIMVTVEVQGKPLAMELDTGVAVSVISTATKVQMFQKLLYSTPLLSYQLTQENRCLWQEG